jgi:ferredoxin
VIGRLRKIPSSVLSPVLGCTAQTNAAAHVKTSCLGFLSEEHLIALSFLIHTPLQLNLTGCSDCDNGFIMETIEKRICDIEANGIQITEKIRMIKDTSGLDFCEISYDRRGFFSALKNLSFAQAAVLFDSDSQEDEIQSYTSKKLPFRRQLMNRIVKIPANECAGLKNYYYEIMTSEACNNCFACVGMCPTGALKIDSGEDRRTLVFSSSLCTGCGLCKDFCTQQAIQLNRGFSGVSPFDFQPTMGHSVWFNPKEKIMDLAKRCCNGV